MAVTRKERSIVDLHTHGIEGLDTRDAQPSLILEIAEKHGEAGVSGILLSLCPGPVASMRAQMSAIERAMTEQSLRQEGSWPQGGRPARILGVHLEGPFLNPARCGALDPGYFLMPDEKTFRHLAEGFEKIVRTVTIAPELPGAEALIRLMADAGIVVNMGHSDATYAEAEAAFRAGAHGITHLFNAMRPFHHREPGIAGFGLVNREVYVEVIGDLLHVSRQALELVFSTKDPGRIILVSDSVRETGLTGNREPRKEDGRLLGGALPLTGAVERLLEAGFDPATVTRAATETPREYINP
jgi:N-acetylglucosamine-6-phosphate deacetylase